MISDPRGSARSAKSESEVKTRAVSRVVLPPLFFAKMEKTAKVRIGAKTWVTYARCHVSQSSSLQPDKISFHLPNVIFQIKSFLNFLDMSSSSMRRFCRLSNSVCFNPLILMPFIAPSIALVADMRFSIASSHMACRDMMKFIATIDPSIETAVE
jgi:hypothetical protein